MAKYVIIDLETTGLDPETGSILEVSAVVVDNNLKELDRFSSIVLPLAGTLESMNDFVRKMHTTNGLLADIDAERSWNSLRTPEFVEASFVEFLVKHSGGIPNNLYLVGNSIPSLDLPYLRKYMPKVCAAVHYRSIDITGLRLGIALITGTDLAYPKAKGHRGLADALECLGEMRYMKEHLPNIFKPTADILMSRANFEELLVYLDDAQEEASGQKSTYPRKSIQNARIILEQYL